MSTIPLVALSNSNREKENDDDWDGFLGYLTAAFVAALLTLTCPNTDLDWSNLLPILSSYLWTLWAFFQVEGSDPGYLSVEIIARLADGYSVTGQEQQKQRDEKNDLLDSAFAFVAAERGTLPQQRRMNNSATLSDDNHAVIAQATITTAAAAASSCYSSTRRKICRRCRIAAPLRAHHCKVCQQCVATFDHHCDFISTCIGERNRCRFWWFLAAQSAGFAVSCRIVGSSKIGFASLFTANVSWGTYCRVFLAKLYLYPLTAAAWVMLLIHGSWAVCNATTFEWSRGRHLEYLQAIRPRDLPFSAGVCHNLNVFCFGGSSSSSRRRWKPVIWQPPHKHVRRGSRWYHRLLRRRRDET